jgi:hypothetical protein
LLQLIEIKDLDDKIGFDNIKNPKYNKTNELLIFKTNNKLNLKAKRITDFIFYSVKQKLIIEKVKSIEEINNYVMVSITLNDLYMALGSENTSNYAGFKGYLIKTLKELKKIKIIKINLVKDSMEIKNSSIKNEEKFLKKVKDKELDKYEENDIVGTFRLNGDKIDIFVGDLIAKQLFKNNNYTKFNCLINNFLKSIYSINLYHYLISSFQAQTALMGKGKKEKETIIQTAFIELDKFYEIMDVENLKISKTFSRFNDLILKKTIKELNESKVVEFKIIEVLKKRNGRKINKLAFLLESKEDYYYPLFDKENNKIFLTNGNYCELKLPTKAKNKDDDKKIIKPLKKVKEDIKIVDNWNDWRKKLLNKKDDFILILEDEIFKLKNGYLFKNDELLSSEKALEIWQKLYESRDKVKIMSEDEYLQEQIKKAQEEENKYAQLKEIKEKFSGKNILGKINKDTPITEYKIMAIQFGDNGKIELHLEEEYSKKRSITLFPNVETLENFLEKARENYLKIS